MCMKRLLTGLAVLCSLTFTAVPDAAGVTLDEFERMNSVEKDRLMFTVLNFYHYQFTRDPATAHKANCMIDLNKPRGESEDPYLMTRIMLGLDRARAERGNNPTVEGVVKRVIERECAAP